MTWEEKKNPPHKCSLPQSNGIFRSLYGKGSTWVCGKCKTRWVVTGYDYNAYKTPIAYRWTSSVPHQ